MREIGEYGAKTDSRLVGQARICFGMGRLEGEDGEDKAGENAKAEGEALDAPSAIIIHLRLHSLLFVFCVCVYG